MDNFIGNWVSPRASMTFTWAWMGVRINLFIFSCRILLMYWYERFSV